MVTLTLMGRSVFWGQPHHCICANASRGLSATAEFLVVSLHFDGAVAFGVWTTAASSSSESVTLAGSPAVSILNTAARLACNGRIYSTVFHLCCVICTGCASQNVFRSVWPFLCSAAASARHRNIWRETYRRRRRRIFISPIAKKNNYNTNIMSKHRGGFPEGQSPIVLDTLSNAEYNIRY